MFHPIIATLSLLAQIKAHTPDEPRLEDGSEAIAVLMGAILVAGIMLIAFRPSKRDRVES